MITNINEFKEFNEKKQLSDVKPKQGKMHKALGVPADKDIIDVYTSGKKLATDLVKAVGKKKATGMITFVANINPEVNVYDKALKALAKIDESVINESNDLIKGKKYNSTYGVVTFVRYNEDGKTMTLHSEELGAIKTDINNAANMTLVTPEESSTSLNSDEEEDLYHNIDFTDLENKFMKFASVHPKEHYAAMRQTFNFIKSEVEKYKMTN